MAGLVAMGALLGTGCASDGLEVCGADTYSLDGDCAQWSDCPAGEYVSAEGSAETDRQCAPCPAGMHSASVNATSCQADTECVAGQYISGAGSVTDPQTCTGCTSATFSDTANASECGAWTVCTAGTYVSADGSAMADRECAVCAAGTYTGGDNQSTCVPEGSCAPGSVQTTPGTRTSDPVCETCVAGEHCPGGDSPASPCGADSRDADSWDHDFDPSTACVPRTACVAGMFVSADGDATTDRSCAACAGGSFSAETNAASCALWTACDAGQYVSAAGSTTVDRTCQTCGADTYSTTTNASSCDPWTTCAPGTSVTSEGSATNDRSCAACQSGLFSAASNAASCESWTLCTAGQYVSVAGADDGDQECTECVPGTYTSGNNQSICVDDGACAPGTVETTPGTSTSAPECAICSAGEYCAGDTAAAAACVGRTWDHDADPATPCLDRSLCSPGTSVLSEGDATNDRQCEACPSGRYSDMDNVTLCSDWTVCVAGEYVTLGPDASTDRVCSPCASDAFSTTTNADSCTTWLSCIAGQYELSPASASSDRVCAGCMSGQYSTTTDAGSCMAWSDCDPGTYVNNTPSDTIDRVCSDCTAGTRTTAANQSMCVANDACMAGTVQTAAGTSTSAPVCEACSAGQYCAGGIDPVVACGSGSWDHDSAPATACAGQTECALGQYVSDAGSSIADRMCTACSAGEYTDTANATSCTAWTVCASGYSEGVAGSNMADRTCVADPWTRQWGTTNLDVVRTMALDSEGSVLVAGTLGDLNFQIQDGDAFVRKYDRVGNTLWTRAINGSISRDRAFALSIDADNNVVVAGDTWGALPGQTRAGGTHSDAFVRMYDPDGNILWTRQFGSSANDGATGVTFDGNGDVWVTGYTAGTIGVNGESNAGGRDVFLWKFSDAGSLLWTHMFGTTTDEEATSIGADNRGDIVVAGYTLGALVAGQLVGGRDAFVRKFTGAGALLWTRQFGSTRNDSADSVGTDDANNVIVVGYTDDTLPGHTSNGAADAFVWKYDAAGTEVWTRQVGTDITDYASAVVVDPGGDILVAGHTEGTYPGQTHSGAFDVFVSRFSSAGVAGSTVQVGEEFSERVYALCDDGGSILVAGDIYGAWPTQSTAGNLDAYVMRLAP